MRTLAIASLFLGLAGSLAAQQKKDDKKDEKPKLDEKFLVGKWLIHYVPAKGKADDKDDKSIEFKQDGTYLWDIAGLKFEGTYKLKGTTLELPKKGEKGGTVWENLSIQDGKIIHPVGKLGRNELIRVKDEKKEEKKN